MHIRPRPWARPELLACGFFIEDCRAQKNSWQNVFPRKQPLHLELGCGKGTFIAALGLREPAVNYLAIDMIDAVLGLSKRQIEQTYAGRPVDNLRLTAWDITRIGEILGPDDAVERIYINFCNPWPKRRYQKKRLTHPRQLEAYKQFMTKDAEIHFKTDCDYLFNDSLKYFRQSGFELCDLTDDLHALNDPENIETEHERMFSEAGIPIKRAIVRQL